MCRVLWPLAGVILAAAPLLAQDGGVPLRINLTGNSSAAVVAATSAGRVPLGRASAGNPLTVLSSALNLGKGQRAELGVDRTGPEPTIVVMAPGGDNRCDWTTQTPETAEAEEQAPCTVLIGYRWGETADLAVNPTLTYAIPGPEWQYPGNRSPLDRDASLRYTVGAEVALKSFTDLEEVACDIPALTGCTVDDAGIGVGGFFEVGLSSKFSIGARYEHSTFGVDQAGAIPTRHDVTLDEFNFYGAFHPFPNLVVRPHFLAGWGLWVNRSDLFRGPDLFEERSQSGGRVFGGVGFDFGISGGLGGRGSLLYGTGGSNDADTHTRAAFGLTLNF